MSTVASGDLWEEVDYSPAEDTIAPISGFHRKKLQPSVAGAAQSKLAAEDLSKNPQTYEDLCAQNYYSPSNLMR